MELLDCSMRDGGYLTNWYYSKEQARACYTAAKECGIKYCEIGFRRTEHSNGPWFYTPESLITETFSDIVTPDCKLALMVQMGTFTIDDFVPRSKSLVSMIRVLVAYHCKDKNDAVLDTTLMEDTVEICKKLRALGYEVCINIGRIDKVPEEGIKDICNIVKGTPIKYLYIADTYGNLGIYKMRNIIATIKKYYTGQLGFHAHDNLKNASVKSIDALYNGVDIVDVTFGGFGRGSGNAKSEYVLAHLNLPLLPALVYTDKWVESYKKSGTPYLLSGLKSMHVNYAIEVIEKHDDITIEQVYEVFEKIVKMNKHHFYSSEVITEYM